MSRASNSITICPACGKRTYLTRKTARQASKNLYPTEHMSVYQCRSKSPDLPVPTPWHLGHLSDVVITGQATRDTVYERTNRHQPPPPTALQALRRIAEAPKNE